jgi:hypothetical protein
MLHANLPQYRRAIKAYTVTNRSPRKHAGRTNARPTGRIEGKPQWMKQRAPCLDVADALAFLLISLINRDGTGLLWHGFQHTGLITPTYGQPTKSPRKAMHKLMRAHQEAETKYYPQLFRFSTHWGMHRSISILSPKPQKKSSLACNFSTTPSDADAMPSPAPGAATSGVAAAVHVLFYDTHSR